MRATGGKGAAIAGFVGSVVFACAIGSCGNESVEPVREFLLSFEMEEPFERYASMRARVLGPGGDRDAGHPRGSRSWRYLGCERGPAVEDASFRAVRESGGGGPSRELIVSLGAYIGSGDDSPTNVDSGPLWPIVEALADPDLTVFQCNVESVERPVTHDFIVFPEDARDADGDRIEPLPRIHASQVVQVAGTPVTSTTTTTSTSDWPGLITYLVQVGVTNDAGTLGALQFDIQAEGSAGGWQGAGSSVNCRFDVAAGLTQCNHKGDARLTCALVDVSGFATPTPIVTCSFRSAESVSASDFSVHVVDASTVALEPAEVTMGVIDIRVR